MDVTSSFHCAPTHPALGLQVTELEMAVQPVSMAYQQAHARSAVLHFAIVQKLASELLLVASAPAVLEKGLGLVCPYYFLDFPGRESRQMRDICSSPKTIGMSRS